MTDADLDDLSVEELRAHQAWMAAAVGQTPAQPEQPAVAGGPWDG
jgi:hypothetical protein